MKKALCIPLILVLLGVLIIPAELFLIGDPVDGAQLYVETSEEGQNLRVSVHTAASAVALRGWSYRQEGSNLYIRARKVLASPVFRPAPTRPSLIRAYCPKFIWAAD